MSNARSRILTVGVAVGLTAAVSAPTAVYASHKFSDVPDDSVYASAVTYLSERGVVRGCGDGSTFCPQADVTRGQLALFLERLSGNGDVAPTVNAATVQGMTAEQLRGQAGPQGPAGPAGPAGPQGEPGGAGLYTLTHTINLPAIPARSRVEFHVQAFASEIEENDLVSVEIPQNLDTRLALSGHWVSPSGLLGISVTNVSDAAYDPPEYDFRIKVLPS